MRNYRAIPEGELLKYGGGTELLSRVYALYEHQKEHFAWLKAGVESLKEVEEKTLIVSGDNCRIQHNPKRIRSTGASISPEAISSRPCFLCPANIPDDQLGLELHGGFSLLCNPVPIFPRHFTITHREHLAQNLQSRGSSFLIITEMLAPDLAVFFNGALAGASAPDHLHFQACPREEFPLVKKIDGAIQDARLGDSVSFAGNLYQFFCSGRLQEAGQMLEAALAEYASRNPEGLALVNVISWKIGGEWRVVIMRRAKHRPDCYYEEGPAKLLVSPAAVELSGVVVLPMKSNYENIISERLGPVLREVVAQWPPRVHSDKMP